MNEVKQVKKVRMPFIVALVVTVLGTGGLVTYNFGANTALDQVVEFCNDPEMLIIDNTIFECKVVGPYTIGEPS